MAQMEADLGTRLDWIAVDHHNTAHPHTHILLRGITDDGNRLDIAGDDIAHSIRERASEIVTLELGCQTEQEVSRQLEREVDAERFTRLDRMLIAEQDAGSEFADLRPDKGMALTMRQNLALMIDRARKLERMGFTIDGMDGRAHYLKVPAAKAKHISRGSIVAVNPPPNIARTEDENILQQTDAGGIYRPSAHLESVRETLPRIDHERHVQSHVRRLEALRRAGIVERLDADRAAGAGRGQPGWQEVRCKARAHLPTDRDGGSCLGQACWSGAACQWTIRHDRQWSQVTAHAVERRAWKAARPTDRRYRHVWRRRRLDAWAEPGPGDGVVMEMREMPPGRFGLKRGRFTIAPRGQR